MVNLKAKPFNLDDEAIKWVEDTIASMTIEEKIGQLFVNLGITRDEEYLKNVVNNYHIGAARYNPGSAAEIHQQNVILQTNSKIPLFIASNLEGGGNGACGGGTEVGLPVKIGATNDPKYAYEMGRISGIEGAATGSNWTFAPLVDINLNWRNPIISSRCFSNEAEKVLANALGYFKGVSESNMICAMKHFPGDGIDERDHHISNAVMSLGCEEWDKSYGLIYKGLIDEGIQSVMIGHFLFPAYTKHFNPTIKDEDILPASLCKEITTDLLKGKLGFNGLVVTDASHMVGMTCAMKRKDVLPQAIAAGCDMFLFFNDLDEDFGYMMEGYKNGVITEERLHDALTRILGAKAGLGLHKKAKEELVPPVEGLSVVGCEEHQKIAKEVADKAITLVKNKQDVLPLSVEKHKKILIVPVGGVTSSGGSLFSLIMPKGPSPADKLAEKLRAKGFDVEMYVSPLEELAKKEGAEKNLAVMKYFLGKSPVGEFVDKYDLIITAAAVNGTGMTVERVGWGFSKGGKEIPWYVHEIPTIVVSFKSPFLLADVPQAKTYINTYDANEVTIDALVAKLTGESEFVGVDPVDAFCGMWDTRL